MYVCYIHKYYVWRIVRRNNRPVNVIKIILGISITLIYYNENGRLNWRHCNVIIIILLIRLLSFSLSVLLHLIQVILYHVWPIFNASVHRWTCHKWPVNFVINLRRRNGYIYSYRYTILYCEQQNGSRWPIPLENTFRIICIIL